MARVKQLGVWLGPDHVATLHRVGPARVSCEYTSQTLAAHPLGIPLLSCSLPLRRGRRPAWPFVTGLLPEGRHRTSMSRLAGVESHDALGMLARFGRDVAGALVVAATSGEESGWSVEREPRWVMLTEADLHDEVAGLDRRTLAIHDDSELSLAGLEDKLLLVRTEGGWARPVHGYPSTHILKLDNRVNHGTVVLEHECLQLARRAGIPAAASELAVVGDATCIIVERFDRESQDGTVRRLHQEDACQALGIDPAGREGGRGKYESSGGPTFAQVAALLAALSAEPDEELRRLLERAVFTVAIGDADAHGKNLSLLHPTSGTVSLAPLYDTVPTALWPRLRRSAAMRINGRETLHDVSGDDLVEEARRWGVGNKRARQTVVQVCERLRHAVESVQQVGALDLERLVTDNLDRMVTTLG